MYGPDWGYTPVWDDRSDFTQGCTPRRRDTLTREQVEFENRMTHQARFLPSSHLARALFTVRSTPMSKQGSVLIEMKHAPGLEPFPLLLDYTTETKIESGTSQSKSGTSVNLSYSGFLGDTMLHLYTVTLLATISCV